MSRVAWTAGIVLGMLGLLAAGLVLFTAWTARQVEKRLPPRGRFIEIDGAHIHYIDEGSGPPLLLVHGLAGQMGNFTHSLLEKLSRDYRVIVLDRPGSGYSTRPPGASAAIGEQARTISRFCQALGLERPLIAAHSLGGAIALSLALNHPEQVGGLALIAPVTRQPDRVPPPFDGLAIGSPLIRRVVAWTLATPLSIANRNRALTLLFGPQPVPPDFATKGGGLLNLRPCSFIGASCDLVAAHQDLADLPARCKNLTVPLGILYGTDDRILDPAAHGRALAASVPGVDFELIEGGGHMILISSAERSAAFIARMAQRVAAADATLAPVA
jgi:pimeloyl-ACP methyl ester carboxylesterase